MTDNAKTMTTAEYAKYSGRSVSTVTKMLREGKLSGEKRGGKWVIFADNVDAGEAGAKTAPATPAAPAADPTVQPANGDAYPIEAFARMTYLTEKGVRQFLASGRLTGSVDDKGQMLVDAGNLKRPEIKHLVR